MNIKVAKVEANKIRSDDTNLPYRSSTIGPMNSRMEIDGILARWQIKKVAWEWDLEAGKISLSFELNENFRGQEINTVVRLEPPIIWKKKKRRKPEEIDWKLSMRILFWYIKNQLAWVYSKQGEKIVAFLPHIAVSPKTTLSDHVIPHLNQAMNLKALPEEVSREEVVEAETD